MTLRQLIDAPTQQDFYQAVYQVERQLANDKARYHCVGRDSLPAQELIRFKVDQHLGFPGQPISGVELRESDNAQCSAIDMNISFMGLTGPSGALPQHYSEMVLARLKLKDTGMKDFYDLFNHRLISLFYRAWEKYRFSVSYQAGGQQQTDAFSKVLKHFSGPDSLSAYYAGIQSRSSPSAQGLANMLMDFTQGDVDVQQFQGRWLTLSPQDQTRLGGRCNPEGQYARLGLDASLGQRVWDISSAVTITLSFTDKDIAAEYLPGKHKTRLVQQLIGQYLGNTTQFKLQLNVSMNQVPVAQLSRQGLGLGLGCSLMSRPCQSQTTQTLSI
ncbi:type VI secretion system baseplate subunit TssG [Shewanella waksmanii]|uniref:type VI secretion system baseplate subunit TssG n=1 Tax=Shewanella waksmanii TaxID=213783 RepID=UPI0004BA28FD|nr:type VI secretion system baseplate subunit TssG [Shewanella waksmanii]